MKLAGSSGQQTHFQIRADGTITTGGTAQLALPRSGSRSFLFVQNISAGPLYLEFGSARAHCSLSSGAVSSVTVDNGGFGFTHPPSVLFIGGLAGVTSASIIAGQDLTQPAPTRSDGVGFAPASAVAVLSGNAVNSITVQSGGGGYTNPPMVFLVNAPEDPFGCATPSATSGILLPANGGSYYVNGTVCPIDQMAIFGATTGQAFTVAWQA